MARRSSNAGEHRKQCDEAENRREVPPEDMPCAYVNLQQRIPFRQRGRGSCRPERHHHKRFIKTGAEDQGSSNHEEPQRKRSNRPHDLPPHVRYSCTIFNMSKACKQKKQSVGMTRAGAAPPPTSGVDEFCRPRAISSAIMATVLLRLNGSQARWVSRCLRSTRCIVPSEPCCLRCSTRRTRRPTSPVC